MGSHNTKQPCTVTSAATKTIKLAAKHAQVSASNRGLLETQTSGIQTKPTASAYLGSSNLTITCTESLLAPNKKGDSASSSMQAYAIAAVLNADGAGLEMTDLSGSLTSSWLAACLLICKLTSD